MAYQYIKGAISCSNSTSYTGSFIKLQAVGGNTGDDDVAVITEVQYGQLADPHSSTTVTSTTGPITLAAGHHIDGPRYAFTTGVSTAKNGILAYFNDNKGSAQ